MNLKLPEEWQIPDDLGRLPLVVKPREHEPAESILFRLALANGYPSIKTLLDGTPNFPRELRIVRYSRNKYIALVARLCGIPEDLIDAATPHRNSGGMTILGHHFRKIRAVGKARVCPACLSDDAVSLSGREPLRPFRRNWWEIQNIGACPIHAVRLVDRCPKCDKQLKLIDSPVGCDCDRSIDFRRIMVDPVPEEDLIHDRWLLGKLGIFEQEVNKFLDGLPIDIGSRLCMIIGKLVQHNFVFQGKRLASPEYSVRTRSIGWRILQGWPESFENFLDRLVEANSSATKLKSVRTARYGGLITLLQAENSTELEIVFEAIRHHVERHHLVSPTTRILGQKLALGESIALSAAAELARCGEVRFLKIADMLGLPTVTQPMIGTQIVPTVHIEPVKIFMASSMEVTEVARLLGCGPKVIGKLIDSGVLRVKLKGNLSVPHLVDRNDVERLIAMISVPLDEIEEMEDRHLSVKQAYRLTLFGEAGILTAIASGHLKGVGRLPKVPGFRGIIFERSELLEAVQIVTGKKLTKRVLSENGWKTGTLLYLKQKGHLDGSLRSDYIDIGELKAFLDNHVSMNEMLEWDGAPPTRGAIRRTLKESGVQPIIPNSAKVSAFWPRSPARQALSSQPSSSLEFDFSGPAKNGTNNRL